MKGNGNETEVRMVISWKGYLVPLSIVWMFLRKGEENQEGMGGKFIITILLLHPFYKVDFFILLLFFFNPRQEGNFKRKAF